MYECTNCNKEIETVRGSLKIPYCKRCWKKVWKNDYEAFYRWMKRGYLPL